MIVLLWNYIFPTNIYHTTNEIVGMVSKGTHWRSFVVALKYVPYPFERFAPSYPGYGGARTCVRACVRARVRACAYACALYIYVSCARAYMCVCSCVCVCPLLRLTPDLVFARRVSLWTGDLVPRPCARVLALLHLQTYYFTNATLSAFNYAVNKTHVNDRISNMSNNRIAITRQANKNIPV